jgi:hypothetical protein
MRKFGSKITCFLEEGFDVQIGPHTEGLPGYYAVVCRLEELPQCDECEAPAEIVWDDSGHGRTPQEALDNAEAIEEHGSPIRYYKPEDFV